MRAKHLGTDHYFLTEVLLLSSEILMQGSSPREQSQRLHGTKHCTSLLAIVLLAPDDSKACTVSGDFLTLANIRAVPPCRADQKQHISHGHEGKALAGICHDVTMQMKLQTYNNMCNSNTPCDQGETTSGCAIAT